MVCLDVLVNPVHQVREVIPEKEAPMVYQEELENAVHL